jgi:hypothetical protein
MQQRRIQATNLNFKEEPRGFANTIGGHLTWTKGAICCEVIVLWTFDWDWLRLYVVRRSQKMRCLRLKFSPQFHMLQHAGYSRVFDALDLALSQFSAYVGLDADKGFHMNWVSFHCENHQQFLSIIGGWWWTMCFHEKLTGPEPSCLVALEPWTMVQWWKIGCPEASRHKK